ncbi:VRR-NUC domain-containing protein [Mitsuokella jalaludinii]|uniref:VRR-NUC domain-containing protein n=1 Tax=Mitsuokella jalaludinii TaxID=187979 RepID=UPI003F8B4CDE
MNKLERDIEKNFGMILEEWDCLYLKFVSPGHAGVPDRIILTPGGHVIFVELKQAGKKLRPLQVYWQKTLQRMHFAAFVVSDNDSARKCLGYVNEVLRREEDAVEKERLDKYDF